MSSGRATLRFGAAPERHVDGRAGLDVAQADRAGDETGRRRDASPSETPARWSTRVKLSPLPNRVVTIDDRAFGRLGERRDQIVRRHVAPGIGAPGERRDRLRARLVPVGAFQCGRCGPDDLRVEAGCEHPGGGAERGAGGGPAPPVERADLRCRGRVPSRCGRSHRAGAPSCRGCAIGHDGPAERQGGRASRLFQAMIATQKQRLSAPRSRRRLIKDTPGARSS